MHKKLEAVIKYIIDVKRVTDVTPKKLQKLLYYVQSWHLALTAENDNEDELTSSLMFPADFEAWVHGPVIPEVYTYFKDYRGTNIDHSGFEINYEKILNKDELSSIDEVIEIYGNFDGNQLETLSHNEYPWQEARKGLKPLESSHKTISTKTIFRFYAERLV
ncbi:Panacea domain-containing protein [Streptococcus sp. H31]|uniref:Panacea domain-containing protein n=1 Tax=Streptococcus huangxiaojuni TaxID=3237239 RepID=UPI0034A478B0